MIVNRVWRWHFGRGLVRSVDNFGKLGQLPTHPELLDWLAHRLVSRGWSLKRLHKDIMLSRTYQMSTRWDRHAARVDPENSLLWRMPRRRLEAEELRDSILAAGGLLETTMGGTLLATSPFQDLSAGGLARKPSLYESARRSVYLPVLRGALYEMYRTFDFPDPAVSNGDRAVTTVASQALFMMNGRLVERSMFQSRGEGYSKTTASPSKTGSHKPASAILGRPATAGGACPSGLLSSSVTREPQVRPVTMQAEADGWPGRVSAALCCRPMSFSTWSDDV